MSISRRDMLGRVARLAAGVAALRLSGCARPQRPSEPIIAPDSVPVFFKPEYALAAHSFETTRKAAWVADDLERSPIQRVAVVAPDSLTADALAVVHTRAYIDAVRTGTPLGLAQSQGFKWDPGLWQAVLASNGGAVAAALAACTRRRNAGSLSSGLHHARADRGAGFCTFNGLALAFHAVCAVGAKRVLVIDLDAHCGGGTHTLVGADARARIVDIAVDSFDAYRPHGANVLDIVTSANAYVPTIRRRLDEVPADEAFDICIYNAGMDPHEGCPVGGLQSISHEVLAEREELVFAWCHARRLPVAFVLAGGYIGDLDQAGLVAAHRLTLASAARAR